MDAGSLVVAVARVRAKAKLGHGGGLTATCGGEATIPGVPANDEPCNHVNRDPQSPWSSESLTCEEMVQRSLRTARVDLARILDVYLLKLGTEAISPCVCGLGQSSRVRGSVWREAGARGCLIVAVAWAWQV